MCNTVTSWCWRGLLSFLILKLKLFNLYLYVWLDLLDLTLHFHKVDPPPMRLDPNSRSRFVLLHNRCWHILEIVTVDSVSSGTEGGESVLRASPPREGHHSSENCGWCCTQGSRAPPSQSRGSDLHPPHPALYSSQKFFVTTRTLLRVYDLHITQNIPTWAAIRVAPPSCFFFDSICLYLCVTVRMCVCVCVCVCVHVYTIWKKILKVKKCHHNNRIHSGDYTTITTHPREILSWHYTIVIILILNIYKHRARGKTYYPQIVWVVFQSISNLTNMQTMRRTLVRMKSRRMSLVRLTDTHTTIGNNLVQKFSLSYKSII